MLTGKGQSTVEYLAIFAAIALATLFSVSVLFPRVFQASEQAFNEAATDIIGTAQPGPNYQNSGGNPASGPGTTGTRGSFRQAPRSGGNSPMAAPLRNTGTGSNRTNRQAGG